MSKRELKLVGFLLRDRRCWLQSAFLKLDQRGEHRTKLVWLLVVNATTAGSSGIDARRTKMACNFDL